MMELLQLKQKKSIDPYREGRLDQLADTRRLLKTLITAKAIIQPADIPEQEMYLTAVALILIEEIEKMERQLNAN